MKKKMNIPTIVLLVLFIFACNNLVMAQFVLVDKYKYLDRYVTLWTSSIDVINMIPNVQSNETNQDSEPNLAVDPTNTSNIVGSAFTPNPTGSTSTAPIFISVDGGDTWSLNNIVPSGNGMTGDISIKFGTSGSELYAGILLGGSGLRMNILRSDDPWGTTAMELLIDRSNVDQPYVNAITSLGFRWKLPTTLKFEDIGLIKSYFLPIPFYFFDRDRVFVGNNDFNTGTQTATVDHSPNARTSPPPAGFTSSDIEDRTTNGQDRPSIRCSANSDGTVYALFARTTASSGNNRTCDVTVVRDDAFATGTDPFSDLKGSDGTDGVLVATGINMPFINAAGGLGQNRLGSHMSICVDPNNSDEVYISWTDRPGSSGTSLHVRRSDDRGVTWSSDILTITNGLNPAVAVNTSGIVGILYQQLDGNRWETHFQRSANDGATWDDKTLADTPDNNPPPAFQPYLGDYCDLMCVGRNFYGVFSASNIPDNNNFPLGVTYQRNADFTAKQLRNTSNTANVNVSIDPFFFKVEYKPGLIPCKNCIVKPFMEKNHIILECPEADFCQIRDQIPENCLVKFDCPGCERTALCPPYFHIYLEDFDPDAWVVELRTLKDEPVRYEINKTEKGLVLSFRPSKELYLEHKIGDYDLVFNATEKVKPNTKYKVTTRLEVSDYRFTQHQKYFLK